MRRALQLFREVCELSGEELNGRLRVACGEDAELMHEVRRLLDEDRAPSAALGPAAVAVNQARFAEAIVRAEHREPTFLPERIGSFRVLRRIGAGGMGVVFEAEQERPARRVALKVVHPDLASPGRLSRLEREAGVMARLEHPGIARLYEAGLDDLGRGPQPYFAMELVEGPDLRRFCVERSLDLRARLRLFVTLCEAVQHAHERGVVHRDLKPENILVRENGQPVVLDFGVARMVATAQDAAAVSLTMHGGLVGTLQYMSPEQASGRDDIDAPSDVYSLGVMLFELLAGRHPHLLEGMSIAEALRELSQADAARLADVVPRFRGDLDAITSKALDPRPARRYPDAGALGADVARHLAARPVHARPHGPVYRLTRVARRNRALFTGGALALIALIGGSVVSLLFALRAIEGRHETERESYRGWVGAAGASLDRWRPEQALEHLASVPLEQRGWEWYHLARRASGGAIRLDASASLRGEIAFDPTLELLCGLGAGELLVWSSDDGRLIRRLPAPGGLSCLAREADQGTLVGGTSDGRLLWIDFESGAVVRELSLPSAEAVIDVSVQSRELLLAASRSEVFLAEGDELTPVHSSAEGVSLVDVELHPNEPAYLASFVLNDVRPDYPNSRGRVHLYQLDDGGELARGSPAGAGLFRSPRFSPDGMRVAVGGRYGMSGLLEAGSLMEVQRLGNHTGVVAGVAWSGDGLLLASLSREGRLCVREIESGAIMSVRVLPLEGELARVADCRFLDEDTVLTSRVGGAELWRFRDEVSRVLRGHSGYVYNARFLDDGKTLVSRTFEGELYVWDVLEGRRLASLDTGQGEGRFSMAGETILVRKNKTLLSVDLATLRVEAELRGEDLSGMAWEKKSLGADMALAPSGRWFAAAKRGTLLDLESGDRLLDIGKAGTPAAGVCFHPNESVVLFASDSVAAYSYPEGTLLYRLPAPTGGAYSAAFSPDGSRLAVGGADGSIGLWDPHSGLLLTTLDGHTNYVRSLDWSPDGTLLASASGDGTIRLWDSASNDRRTDELFEWLAAKDAVRADVEAVLDLGGSADDAARAVRAKFAEADPHRTAALRVLLELVASD